MTKTTAAETFQPTVLEIAEATFATRFADTGILSVPGELLGAEFAGRDVSPVEARAALFGNKGKDADSDRVWRHLVNRSREEGGDWTLVAVGMAAPMLKRCAASAAERFSGERQDDLAAEILAGFLTHLAVMDIERPGICVRLRWAVRRATDMAVCAGAEQPVARFEAGSMPPVAPASHPDLVLSRAERTGVITKAEADLIGMTRLDEVSLAEAATCLGITANAAKIRRQKAEARLVAFLTGRPVPSRADLKHARTRPAKTTFSAPAAA